MLVCVQSRPKDKPAVSHSPQAAMQTRELRLDPEPRINPPSKGLNIGIPVVISIQGRGFINQGSGLDPKP